MWSVNYQIIWCMFLVQSIKTKDSFQWIGGFLVAKKKKKQHDQDQGNQYREETAAELTPESHADRDVDTEREDMGATGLGVTAIILSVLAFFFWPYLFSFLGIILGIVAGRRGSATGWWAVGIGALVLLFRILAFPFMAIF